MARKLIGIRQNVMQVIISGARVPFDSRTTAEVEETRDPENYKAAEKAMRTRMWEMRKQDERRQAAE